MNNASTPLNKIKLRRWGLTKAIIEVIIIGFASGGGHPLKPTLPLMISTIIKLLKENKKISIEEKKIRRVLENLEKRDVISLQKDGSNVFVHTINNNKRQVIKYSIKILLEFKNNAKKWNHKWFMVFFDVPEIQRGKRDYLRKFLVELGFYPYQKSVYLFPYECEKEVTLIKKIVSGAKYMKYIIAEKIEDEKIAKSYFNLT